MPHKERVELLILRCEVLLAGRSLRKAECLCNKQQTNRDVDEEEDGPDEVQSQQTVLHEFSVSLDVATIA